MLREAKAGKITAAVVLCFSSPFSPMVFRSTLSLLSLATALSAADFPQPFDSEKGSPMSPAEAVTTMELPKGFQAQLFAAEPDVRQPIGMAWDKKGRIWVAENYTYAENPRRWDTTLKDRIILLEDKDGDGKHDVRKVFWEQGSYLTSVELGYGGVWILNDGKLAFIADKNGDDLPDGEPEIHLDGFNTKTIGHNIVNGLRWGPDGWLYGRHGITDTSLVGAPGTPAEKRTAMNCAIWRYHPTRRVLEVVCHGGTNSWGHDWDRDGELFHINTVIGHLWHSIPGAYYRRMFGTHLNPHVYEIIEQTADHFHWDTGAEKWSDLRDKPMSGLTDQLGGGHAHVGCLIYQGGTWPAEYHNVLLTCNLHGRRINVDKLVRDGCGYTGKHAPDFLKVKDPWFRGIEILGGPDGNIYVSDWSDTGECHDNDGVHRSSGRIYKISYGAAKPAGTINVADMTEAELLAQLDNPNQWWVRMARQTLYERGSEKLATHKAPSYQSENEHERVAALRRDVEAGAPNLAQQCQQLAEKDASGLVRLYVASTLQRLPIAARWPIATALARHAEDGSDRQQPLMIWYGIEPAIMADPAKAVALIGEAKIPTVRRLVSRRIAEEIEKHGEVVESLVALALANQDARADIVRGLAAGLDGLSKAEKPKSWDALSKIIDTQGEEDVKNLGRNLSIVFGSGRAMDELVAIIKNAEGDASARRNAFTSLTRGIKPELMPIIRGLINDKVLGTVARRALASYDDPSIPVWLVKNWPVRSEEQQAATVETLCSRPAYADALLNAMKEGRIPTAALTPYQARQIRSLDVPALTDKLTAVWGELRESPEAKQAEIAKWKAHLTKETLATANPGKGRTLFQAICSACHRLYGQGGQLGPDLTGSDRHNLDYLLGNIIDPSSVVPNDYRMSIFTLKDGRIITGVVPEQTQKMITVQTPAERIVIERGQIAKTQVMPMSMMPEGLFGAMTPDQVRDIIAYMMTQAQVNAE